MMPPPPAAHADPDPDPSGVDGRPEPDAAAYLIDLTDEPVEPKTATAQPTPTAQPARRKAARKGGRPNVPAWDEIMFGSKPRVDHSSS